jgi:hypothetical protein
VDIAATDAGQQARQAAEHAAFLAALAEKTYGTALIPVRREKAPGVGTRFTYGGAPFVILREADSRRSWRGTTEWVCRREDDGREHRFSKAHVTKLLRVPVVDKCGSPV